jgi:hypothetical protein
VNDCGTDIRSWWTFGGAPRRSKSDFEEQQCHLSPRSNHTLGSRRLRIIRKRNEVRKPQEGRWSPRRRTGPVAIETLRSSGGLRCPREARERRLREAGGRRNGEEILGGEKAQGSSELLAGITLRVCDGLPEGARPRSRARPAVEAACRSSQRHVGKSSSRGGFPLREGQASKGEAHERARHETRPWRSREKKRARRAHEPWRRNVPGEANPGRVGSRDRKR